MSVIAVHHCSSVQDDPTVPLWTFDVPVLTPYPIYEGNWFIQIRYLLGQLPPLSVNNLNKLYAIRCATSRADDTAEPFDLLLVDDVDHKADKRYSTIAPVSQPDFPVKSHGTLHFSIAVLGTLRVWKPAHDDTKLLLGFTLIQKKVR